MHTTQPEPIAIVGSGCRFPGGANSPSSLWKLLETPRDVSTEIPNDRFELKGYYHPKGAHHGTTNVQRAYMLEEDFRKFDTGFFNISPNEAESMGESILVPEDGLSLRHGSFGGDRALTEIAC